MPPVVDRLGQLEELVLLALVRLRENAYGVTIRRELEERTGRNYSVGAIYTTLDRMEAKGYVSSKLGEPTAERGGRAKKFFKIEALGVSALHGAQQAVAQMREGLAHA